MFAAILFICATQIPEKKPPSTGDAPDRAALGMIYVSAQEASAVAKEHRITVPPNPGGVLVLKVLPGGPADRAGLKPLDFLVGLGDATATAQRNFLALQDTLQVGVPVQVRFRRPRIAGKKVTWETRSVMVTPVRRADLQPAFDAIQKQWEAESRSRGPLHITRAVLTRNLIHVPELRLSVENTDDRPIVAFEVLAECYDRFGDKAVDIGDDHTFRGISQRTIPPGQTTSVAWSLAVHSTAAKVHVRIARIKFADGSEWRPEDPRVATATATMAE